MKKYLIYAWSFSTVLVGEDGVEIDGAYVIINECLDANNEEEALRITSEERNIKIEDLIAVEIH
ncbi:MAG: hypothetical protein IJ086_15980 [Clostridium sp.]|nr:hypothetical protein [Clostridium sp.]MBQ9000174.1 hypothetical protein [Clostridium sp.]